MGRYAALAVQVQFGWKGGSGSAPTATRWGYMITNPAKLAGPNRQPAPLQRKR